MHSHLFRIRLVSLFVAAGVIVFAAASARAFLIVPTSDLEIEVRSEAAGFEAAPGTPTRLLVPSIGLDARVQHTGITARGTMAVPDSYYDVGWYRHGPAPGERGSAVIAGHVDNGAGLDAVFADVHTLRPGDEIFIQTNGGDRVRFLVTGVKTYPYDAVPAETVFNRADRARLNLITCSGDWIAEEATYDERVVVYTVRA